MIPCLEPNRREQELMIRPRWKHLFLAAVLAAAIVGSVSQASAHWRGCCQPSCWSCDPCCTSWGCGYSPYYSCGWTGPCCSTLGHHCLGWRSCGLGCGCGYYGGWGYSGLGWSYYGCGDCCGAGWLADCGCNGTVVGTPAAGTPTPAVPGNTPAPPASPPATPPKTESNRTFSPGSAPNGPSIPAPSTGGAFVPQTDLPGRADSGMLTLHVPSQAKVYVNGQETRSIGSQREYVSFGLEKGKTYPYSIKVATPVSINTGGLPIRRSDGGFRQGRETPVELVNQDGLLESG